MFRPSARTKGLALSQIVRISEAAARMRAEGHDVLALSTGEPDLPTPELVCAAATRAMNEGRTRYTPTAGTPDLRRAIAATAGFPAQPAEVIVSTGAKQVLANIFLATLDDGCEVILPTPCWSSYTDMVTLAGGRAVEVCCGPQQGFKITPAQLEAAITPRTRWLLLNSPSNPTGALYGADELAALAGVLRRHPHVWIASDEIYAQLSYVPFTSFRTVATDLADRTIIVSGVSKAYSMTGWRIGWGIGPQPLIDAMVAVQGQVTSGACSIAQAAAVEALTGDQAHLATRLAIFRARRDRVIAALVAIPGLECATPDGAFYVFPDCRGLLGRGAPDGKRIDTDNDFCDWLLASEGLALVPGSAFGLPGHLRLSYAYSDADLADGCARLARAVARLTPLPQSAH